MFLAGLALTVPAAAQAPPPALGGPPFSDPTQVIDMPSDWVEAPIVPPEPVDIAITLDQQLYPALLPFIREFARERDLTVAISDGTCGLSAGALADKAADMGGFCCPPGAVDRLPGLRYHTIGVGALALIVHPDNPIRDISLDEVRRVYDGAVVWWSDLPGGVDDDVRVRAVARLHCKVRPGHWRLILDNENLFRHDLAEVGAIVDMVTEVARSPEAIGYETLWHIGRLGEEGAVKPISLDGVDPRDDAALAAGRYPLYRVFNITTWAPGPAHNPLAEELAGRLVARAGEIDPTFRFVPVQRLRQHGWRFHGDELVGEPG